LFFVSNNIRRVYITLNYIVCSFFQISLKNTVVQTWVCNLKKYCDAFIHSGRIIFIFLVKSRFLIAWLNQSLCYLIKTRSIFIQTSSWSNWEMIMKYFKIFINKKWITIWWIITLSWKYTYSIPINFGKSWRKTFYNLGCKMAC